MTTRAYGVAAPPRSAEPQYVDGLRTAIATALDYGLSALETDRVDALPVPSLLFVQARLAARNGVQLDTVVRRYLGGHTLLGDYIAEEAEASGLLTGLTLNRVMRTQAAVVDRLIAAVTDEYMHELDVHSRRPSDGLREQIERLLRRESLDTSGIPYDFNMCHLGVVATGSRGGVAIREAAATLDCRSLLIDPGGQTIWAWLGGREPLEPGRVSPVFSSSRVEGLTIALGEPAEGLAGWCLTHRQASAALPIARHGKNGAACYGEVSVLATILQDELLVTSLRGLYLKPLEAERDGGAALRETLRAYFAAERNVSSASALLSVSRNTVASRLRTVEQRLGKSLRICGTDLEIALSLDGVFTE